MSKLEKFYKNINPRIIIGIGIGIYILADKIIKYYTNPGYKLLSYIKIGEVNNETVIILDDTNMPHNIKHHHFSALNILLKNIPKGRKINIILKSSGGDYNECLTVCQTLKHFISRVFVNEYAYSSGSILALSASELYMSNDAKLSAINPIYRIKCDVTFQYDNGKYTITHIPNDMYNYIQNDLTQSYSKLKNIINPKYNVPNILKCMYDDICDHSHKFSVIDLQTIANNQIKLYDGDYLKVIA